MTVLSPNVKGFAQLDSARWNRTQLFLYELHKGAHDICGTGYTRDDLSPLTQGSLGLQA